MAEIDKDINEALIKDVLQIYADAEDKMLKAVAKRVAKGIKSEGWNETKLKDTQVLKKEIEKVLGDTTKLSHSKVSKGIIDAYKQGKAEVGGEAGVHNTILDELDIPMNLKMQVLATNNLLDNASFQVLRKSNDAYQQVMAHATTGLLAGTDTRLKASQKMLNEFAAKGITTFVDKAGRNWDLGSYAEMCARTVSHNAARQGHIDRQMEVGEDLMKVSTIGTTCPICQRWQGVVLSISGNHPKYHSVEEAKAAGLFHPNCKHTLNMYIPELDDGTSREGKVEPAPLDLKSQSSIRNALIEKQRANERTIRYWKKRKSLAITPEEAAKCDQKIKEWQYKNLIHCEKHNLRRLYYREGLMKGHENGQMGSMIGGNLVEYEKLYKDVVGTDPKKLFGELKMKLNLQFFAEKKYEKWLKEEIQDLTELDVDKAMMKDANNKAVTPTSLYKKYIGDSPMQDYAVVSEYEKGTKEFKSHYTKWLKQQIEEIGVSYKVKPKYVEVHEDIPEEDKSLSATAIYKKYHEGKAPTEAYKEAGGETGTGMKYGKWVETQKKELIKNGITKTVPFNEATAKTAKTISVAQDTLKKAKQLSKDIELKNYQKELDDDVHGNYDGYLKVKAQLDKMNQLQGSKDVDALLLESDKLSLAMQKHLEFVKKKAEKEYGTANFYATMKKLVQMAIDEKDPNMKQHIMNQFNEYEEVKQAKNNQAKSPTINLSTGNVKSDKVIKAEAFLNEVKNDPGSFTLGEIKKEIKDNLADPDVYKIHAEAYKVLVKSSYQEDIDTGFLEMDDLKGFKKKAKEHVKFYKDKGDKYNEVVSQAKLEAINEMEAEVKKIEEEAKKASSAAKLKAGQITKVSLGRETSFKEGKLVERDKIYQELSLEDLEKLSDQVPGHKLFKNQNRRDILGRDRVTARNHHMGHEVGLKTGLSKEEKELGEAFALAYDEYFNTIKCQPINLAYLKGYENATPAMKKKIDAMNKVIQSVELKEPVVLHRFVDGDIVEAIFKTKDAKSLRPGSLYENNTFMSTTTGGHPTFGKRPYMLTLQVDKGTHALPTLNHEELEVLLGKGKLEFVRTNSYTSKSPRKLKNFDGSDTNFVGDEIVVRYIEEGKAQEYEEVTADKIDNLLGKTEVVKKHTTESKPWINSLSKDELTANKRYTGSYYVEMNNVYRRGATSSKNAVKWAEDLTESLRRESIRQPVVLRRGVHETDLAHMLGFNGDTVAMKQNWDKVNEGGYAAEDKGFLSTSPYKSGGFSKSVELRIYCPTGTHAAYVDSISTHRGEQETIIQSGSMYRVVKLAKEGGHTVAYLELLGTD